MKLTESLKQRVIGNYNRVLCPKCGQPDVVLGGMKGILMLTSEYPDE